MLSGTIQLKGGIPNTNPTENPSAIFVGLLVDLSVLIIMDINFNNVNNIKKVYEKYMEKAMDYRHLLTIFLLSETNNIFLLLKYKNINRGISKKNLS